MTLNARRFSLITVALLLVSASVSAQQAPTPQSSADASKTKHPAGVKYEPIRGKSAAPNSPTAQPSSLSAQGTKRKDGAVVAADFNKRQAGDSTAGVGASGDTGKPAAAASDSSSGHTDGARVNKVDSFTIKQKSASNGTAGHAEDTAADKGIGSAGIPGKAASVQNKAQGAPLKGCGKCSTVDQGQKQAAKSAKAK